MRHNRSGVVLLIVVGLVSIMLALALAFISRMRNDAAEARAVLDQAQARVMLHGALMYLQEASRLGWGEESYGWTDVRDGSLGPRGPRKLRNDGRHPGVGVGEIPPPSWWTSGYVASPLDAELPSPGGRRWPMPGTVVRCPMAEPVQTPYATQLTFAYNPILPPATRPQYGEPGWEDEWDPVNLGNIGQWGETPWKGNWVKEIYDANAGAKGMLDPQPVADAWYDPVYVGNPAAKADFVTGAIDRSASGGDWSHTMDNGRGTTRQVQLAVVPGSENQCWFRVYREELADHDNRVTARADGLPDPAYDRVALFDADNPQLKNWNVFVIACGVGATRGYRSWEPIPGIEPVGARDSGLFPDQQTFEELLEASTITWYRVEWQALQGGGNDAGVYYYGGWGGGDDTWEGNNITRCLEAQYATVEYRGQYMYIDSSLREKSIKSFGGNFKWVQRLDHEPPRW